MALAAIMTENNALIQVRSVAVEPPRSGEVAVRIAAAGVCHSDLHVWHRGPVKPIVLGHEASGVIETVGPDVDGLQAGDHVILMPFPQCGSCLFCRVGQTTLCVLRERVMGGCQLDGTTRVRSGDQEVYQLSGLGAFAELAVVPAMSVVPIDRDMDLDLAAIVGCAVATGFGAAVNVGQVCAGETVVVVGCGGVGLSAIQGARISGAQRIVAVDLVADKLRLATTVGATDVVDASSGDAVAQVRELTDGLGAHVTCDMIGSPRTMLEAVAMTRNGGRCVLTGLAGGEMPLTAATLVGAGKALLGNYLGMSDFRVEFPRLIQLYRDGQLMLAELITSRISLDVINEAFDALSTGAVARSVITLT